MLNKADNVTMLCRQLKAVLSGIFDWIMNLMPVFTAAVIIQNVWQGFDVSVFSSFWQIAVIMLGIFAVYISANAVRTALVLKTSPLKVLKAVAGPMMTGFVTDSSMLAYADIDYALKNDLKVDAVSADIGVPLGLGIFGPSAVVMFLVPAVYFFITLNGKVTIGWLVLSGIMIFVLSVSTPPVNNAALAMLSILFLSMGIDPSAFATVCPLIHIMDYPGTAVKVGSIVMEVACVSAGKSRKKAEAFRNQKNRRQ